MLLIQLDCLSAAPSASSTALERERARKREREKGYKKIRAARLATCQDGLAVDDGNSSPSLFGKGYRVEKTAVSERLRVVFVMGLVRD